MGIFSGIVLLICLTLFPASHAASMGLDFGGGGGGSGSVISLDYLGEIQLENNTPPSRVACSPSGEILVAIPEKDRVDIYSNNGILLKSITGLRRPVSVGISGSLIFAGERDGGSVGVYDLEGHKLAVLGGGNGEFGLPSDIAAGGGKIFVVDSTANEIRAYSEEGAFLYSFGGNIFTFPTGIEFDTDSGKVFVTENGNPSIRVFNQNGSHLYDIATSGKLLRPQGLILKDSKIYVTDAYHSTVGVFDLSGDFLGYIGKYGGGAEEFRVPLDLCSGPGGKIFVTDSNNGRVQILGDNSSAIITPEPPLIDFRGYSGGNPMTAEISLNGTEGVVVTVSVNQPWMSVTPSTATIPSSVNVNIDPSILTSGQYTGEITFVTPNGVKAVVKVSLTLESLKEISVVPEKLYFIHHLKEDTLPSKQIFITSTGAEATWTLHTEIPWLFLSQTQGITPSSVTVSLSEDVRLLRPGNYTGNITLEAADAKGSPLEIPVNLSVVEGGKLVVETNRPDATFQIIGPMSITGHGFYWKKDPVPSGGYHISFSHIPGFVKPPDRDITINSGQTVVVKGVYRETLASDSFATGLRRSGILLASLDGNSVDILPTAKPVQKLAAGDTDGDGYSEIIAHTGKRRVIILGRDGLLNIIHTEDRNKWIGDISTYDFDGDGMDEVILSLKHRKGDNRILIYGYEQGGYVVKDSFNVKRQGLKEVAVCDTDGDGIGEIFFSSGKKVLTINGETTSLFYHLNRGIKDLACGDIDNDGRDELVVVGSYKGKDRVYLISETGHLLSKTQAYKKRQRIFIDVADTDGDGLKEVYILKTGRDGSTLFSLFQDGKMKEVLGLDKENLRGLAMGRFK